MTGSRRDLTPVEYSSRIGGGRSARLIALGILGVLGAFVFVGVMGRQSPPPPAAALASATPSAAAIEPGTPAPVPQPAVASVGQIRPDESRPRPYQFLGTVLSIAGSGYIADLEEVEPGRYYAAYGIPFPRPSRRATLQLAEIAATTSHDSWVPLGSWEISLDPISPETRLADKVLDVTQPPRGGGPEVPALARSGYSVTVFAEGRLDFGLLTIEVRRTTQRPLPNEGYAVDVRAGDFATRVQLASIGTGHFSGVLVIPDRVTAEELTLALVAMPAQNPLLGMVTVYDYTIDMPPHGRFNTGDGVSASSGPEPVGPGEAELIGFGHHFQAQTAYSGFQRAVVLDLQIFGGVDLALVSR